MAVSNAVPLETKTRTLGYALDYKDFQTAQGNLPVKILVLTDAETGKGAVGDKVITATAEKVKTKFGGSALAVEVMGILDRLNASQYIDVLAVNPEEPAANIETAVKTGLGDIWYNIVVNPFGQNEEVYTALKNLNGTPAEDGGTGRWNALNVKPFIAISGTSAADTFTQLSEDDMTNIVATAPNAFKDTNIGPKDNPIYLTDGQKNARIAASWAFLAYKKFGTKPYSDISGEVLPYVDYPSDLNIGNMSDFNQRDLYAKSGISTVMLDVGQGGYVVQDFVTGRRISTQPETAKDWSFVRDIFVDFNIAYKYQILQEKTLVGKVIVADAAIVNSSAKGDIIRLKVWKGIVANWFERMESELFITDNKFSADSLLVELSATNPKRINTAFAYKRTATVNIASTTAYAGFAFGSEA